MTDQERADLRTIVVLDNTQINEVPFIVRCFRPDITELDLCFVFYNIGYTQSEFNHAKITIYVFFSGKVGCSLISKEDSSKLTKSCPNAEILTYEELKLKRLKEILQND